MFDMQSLFLTSHTNVEFQDTVYMMEMGSMVCYDCDDSSREGPENGEQIAGSVTRGRLLRVALG
jgi:hypothetical protein